MLFPLMIADHRHRRQTQAISAVRTRGAVPCTDSSGDPIGRSTCVARVDSRRGQWSGDDYLGAGHRGDHPWRVFRWLRHKAGWCRCGSTIGYQSAIMSALSAAADRVGPRPTGQSSDYCGRRPGDDQAGELYADRHAASIAVQPPTTGINGLGTQQALGATTVRPYRSLISAQAIYRREVFQ